MNFCTLEKPNVLVIHWFDCFIDCTNCFYNLLSEGFNSALNINFHSNIPTHPSEVICISFGFAGVFQCVVSVKLSIFLASLVNFRIIKHEWVSNFCSSQWRLALMA